MRNVYGAEFHLTLGSSGKSSFSVYHSTSGSDRYLLTSEDANQSNIYNHLDLHSMTDHGYGTPLSAIYPDDTFGNLLEDALNTGASDKGWGDTFTVTFSTTTFKYTISCTSTFGATGLTPSLQLLGFNAVLSGSDSYTSTYVPVFITSSDHDHMSNVSDEYESNGVGSLAISDGGRPLGIARTKSINFMDWMQQFEPISSTFTRKGTYSKSASHLEMPWTFQSLFEHCRSVYPFVVYNEDYWSGHYPVFLLRDDGANFKPQRAIPDYDGYWHIPFRTYLYGWIT